MNNKHLFIYFHQKKPNIEAMKNVYRKYLIHIFIIKLARKILNVKKKQLHRQFNESTGMSIHNYNIYFTAQNVSLVCIFIDIMHLMEYYSGKQPIRSCDLYLSHIIFANFLLHMVILKISYWNIC